jgi:cytochrome c oxidase subunit 3
MGSDTRPQVHYFVPAPSYWPILGSAALFCLALGAALAVNALQGGPPLLVLGALLLLWMLFGWFGDVIRESLGGAYLGREDMSFRWGMGWFIFSEVMFFGAFFGVLFYVRTISLPALGDFTHQVLYPGFIPDWPRQTGPGIRQPYTAMEAWGLPAINTAILLSSALAVTWAHWSLLLARRAQLIAGLLLTILLGWTFLILQAIEYTRALTTMHLTLAAGAYGMTFFMLTGFHGLHVLLGTLMLAVVWLRVLRGHFDARHHFAFEAAAWYWHFVDVVWLFLFVFVYWL